MGGNGWQSVPKDVRYTRLPGTGHKGKNGKVTGPNYPMPANWPCIQVAAQNLKVAPHALTTANKSLQKLSGDLQDWLGSYYLDAATASGAVGTWHAAHQLSTVIGNAATGAQRFVQALAEAHDVTATGLTQAQSIYDGAESAIKKKITTDATDPQGWVVQAGGSGPQHNDPFYGQNLSPQTKANLMKLMQMNEPGGDSETWDAHYTIKPHSFKTDTSYQNMSYQQINNHINATDPDLVNRGASAFGRLTQTLTGVTQQLAATATALSQNWGGTAAVQALASIQKLHQTATDLQANAYQAGEALQYYGSVLPAFKADQVTVQGGGYSKADLEQNKPTPVDQANSMAQQKMKALNGHIATTYQAIPLQLNKNLPGPPKLPSGSPSNPGGSGGGPGIPGTPSYGGGVPGTPSSGGGVPPATALPVPAGVPGGSPSGPGAVTSVPPAGAGVTLSGTPPVTPPATQPTTLPQQWSPSPPPATPPVVPTTFPGAPPVTDPGSPKLPTAEGPADGDPIAPGSRLSIPRTTAADNGLGSSSAAGGGDEAGSDGLSVAGEGGAAGAAEGPAGYGGFGGMGGMGGMGGGSGSGQDRQRQSWASEDDDLWDSPGTAAVIGPGAGFGEDGMIGGDAGGTAEGAFGSDIGYGPGGIGGSAAAGEYGPAEGGGFPFMAGAGAGGGQEQQGRARQAWMNEDADIWADADSGVPPVLG